MAPWNPGRERFRSGWLVVSALAALVVGCGTGEQAPSSSATRPDRTEGASGAHASAGTFVSAGGRMKSAKYVVDFALGQSTQNQGQSTSTSYLVRGGLIGGNGRVR
jgi:hypothetical protein